MSDDGPNHDVIPAECPNCGEPVTTVDVHGISPEDARFSCGCSVPADVYQALANWDTGQGGDDA